jgi:hypothetical protein
MGPSVVLTTASRWTARSSLSANSRSRAESCCRLVRPSLARSYGLPCLCVSGRLVRHSFGYGGEAQRAKSALQARASSQPRLTT